ASCNSANHTHTHTRTHTFRQLQSHRDHPGYHIHFYNPAIMVSSTQHQVDKAASRTQQKPSSSKSGSKQHLLPGIRCPTCHASGKEVWVLPGKECGYCGTPCG
ncbi:hypothetical protein LX32DRAFT_604793, partial [Colletotrichum zoysiae]